MNNDMMCTVPIDILICHEAYYLSCFPAVKYVHYFFKSIFISSMYYLFYRVTSLLLCLLFSITFPPSKCLYNYPTIFVQLSSYNVPCVLNKCFIMTFCLFFLFPCIQIYIPYLLTPHSFQHHPIPYIYDDISNSIYI